jgi:hypothetical protein
MSSVTYVLSIVVMLAVAAVLVRGLVNMARGGSGNLSNKLMQMRVLLQFCRGADRRHSVAHRRRALILPASAASVHSHINPEGLPHGQTQQDLHQNRR